MSMDINTGTVPTRRDQLDQLHKTVTRQMRQNLGLQTELLKAIGQFRSCADNMAQASDEIAKVISKAALITMTSHQTLKDYRRMRGEQVTDAEELKQRKLSAALQQIVKFQTLLSTQQQLVSNALLLEFDRPISENYEKYRDVSQMWEKDYEKETRRLQSDIRHKESESAKLGKSPKNMEKLSTSLHELSDKITDLERVKIERLESAISIDRHQHLLLAHHLQQCLKAEVLCYKNVYYQQNTPVPSASPLPSAQSQQSQQQQQPSSSSGSQVVLTVNTSAASPTANRQLTGQNSSTSLEHSPLTSGRRPSEAATDLSSADEERANEQQAEVDDDDDESVMDDVVDEYTRASRKNSSFFGSSLPPSKSAAHALRKPMPANMATPSKDTAKFPQPPSRVSSRYESPEQMRQNGSMGQALQQLRDRDLAANSTNTTAEEPQKPRAPQNPHRKTMAPPATAINVQQLRQHIMGEEVEDNSNNNAFRAPVFRNSALGITPDGQSSSHGFLDINNSNDHSTLPSSSSVADSELEQQQQQQHQQQPVSSLDMSDSKDWAVVQYDYTAQTDDDLTVFENDVLRVVAVEGEWMYALLLESQNGAYVPAKVDGRHQTGWVPYSFTEPY